MKAIQACVVLLAFLLCMAVPAIAQTNLAVSAPVTDATGATFTVTWTGVSFAWTAGYGDGSAAQQGTSISPLKLKMPYHASGVAASGFVCLPQQNCAGLSVPAKPTTPLPGSTHPLNFLEPKSNVDGTTLNDLASIRAYYRVDGGAENVVTYPASGLVGGKNVVQDLTVSATSGTLTVQVAAVDLAGNEGPRSTIASKTIGSPPPPPPPPTTFLMTTAVIGQGTVSGAGPYPSGQTVPVMASPALGWGFASWSGACTGSAVCSVLMNGNKSVTATFAQLPTTTTAPVISKPCTWTVMAPPPDAVSGWTMQLKVAGVNIAPAKVAAPYQQTVTLQPGTGSIVAQWSKTGAATKLSDPVPYNCMWP